jgi:hypothetical protein
MVKNKVTNARIPQGYTLSFNESTDSRFLRHLDSRSCGSTTATPPEKTGAAAAQHPSQATTVSTMAVFFPRS